MGTVIGNINPSVGQFGQKAALAYQALKPVDRASTTVQYTPNIEAKGASHDLFAYAHTFAKNPNDFTAEEIKAASGLDLAQLDKPNSIKRMWDTNKDNKIDLKEAFVGLAHLDSADGQFDGKITQEGRQEIARLFFDEGVKQRIKPLNSYLQDIELIGSAEGLKDLRTTIVNELIAQGIEHTPPPVDLINEKAKPDLKLLAAQTRLFAQAVYPHQVKHQIHLAQREYTNILSQVGQALDITEKFHGYQCACCPKP